MAKHCFFPTYFVVLDLICLNITLWGALVVVTSAVILITVWSKSDMKKDVATSRKLMKPRLLTFRVLHETDIRKER
jgi:hypothetical protein